MNLAGALARCGWFLLGAMVSSVGAFGCYGTFQEIVMIAEGHAELGIWLFEIFQAFAALTVFGFGVALLVRAFRKG